MLTLLSLALALACAPGSASARAPPLGWYQSLADADVTVSGLSSGAFFAHQFEVAYSALVSGAGLIAGGPYGCAGQIPWFVAHGPFSPARAGIAACTGSGTLGWVEHLLAGTPDPSASAARTRHEHDAGDIDDPVNLHRHRVWILAGGLDDMVAPTTTAALRAYYRVMGVPPANIRFEEWAGASHGLPVEEFEGKSDYPKRTCSEGEPPYIIDCNRDAAELLFRHLFPGTFRGPGIAVRERLLAFDQTEFFQGADASISMADTGHVYVPSRCGNGAAECHLHVAFHACQQNEEFVGDDFYWDGGYNRWAEANDIVVLYPQTSRWDPETEGSDLVGNPAACWDWWGYTGRDFDNKRGKQMSAIRAMIRRIAH
jgi:poly(3-hydroxybutyrate) depolymerase